MIYGLIICAGNQSRFKTKTPKALMNCGNITLLDLNINNMKDACDEVIVVCSTQNKAWFDSYNTIEIESGFGCGDAVMKALQKINLELDDTVFIQWGDSIQEKEIYQLLVKEYNGKILIPCVHEDSPYVQIIREAEDKVKVLFSKYGEPITSGLHDLSLFYGNGIELLKNLEIFSSSIMAHGKYEHKHGNEMQFLDVFNETSLPVNLIVLESFKAYSFNTIEEFEDILTTLNIS